MLSLLLACLALSLPSTTPQELKPKVLGVEVTFLANAGFLFESGEYSALIDAFLREPVLPYQALTTEGHKQLANAKPPFDGTTIVLVSHVHPDHVQFRGLEKFLVNNKKAHLTASPQVLKGLAESAREFENVKGRTSAVQNILGSSSRLAHSEMAIEFFQLPHAGKDNEGVVNTAHLVEIGGVKLLHLGDAEPIRDNFRAYSLAQRAIDVVFVPYWFFGTPAGTEILFEEIKARQVVACHIPPSEWEKLNQLMKAQFPEVILFRESMEHRRFEPVPPPSEAPEKPSGG